MAQFEKRGKGWQARIQWRDSLGKRHSKSQGGFATKTLAKKWAVENESSLNNGITIDKDVRFAEYYKHFFYTYKDPKVAQSTKHRYHLDFKVIDTYFKGESIKDISRSQYQDFLNNYGKTHAPSTLRKLNSRIRECVQSAILDGYIIKDFTKQAVITGNESKTIKVEYLNVNEIRRLIKATRAGLNPRYTSRYMILLAIYTGMRKGEIQALTWSDIDFRTCTISVTKSWRELPAENESHRHFVTHRFKKTKTESSVRTIKVNRDILNDLMDLHRHSNSNLVFLNCFGTIPTSNALNHTLRNILSDLGLHRKNFHFHSLRHSHVALLLAKGMDIYAISKRLGHSDISMTANTYAYLIDEYREKADDQVVKILNSL